MQFRIKNNLDWPVAGTPVTGKRRPTGRSPDAQRSVAPAMISAACSSLRLRASSNRDFRRKAGLSTS
jgi:hypothetical protein